MELNRDLLRWVLLIGAAPIWWPFLRMLWRDFNSALREEGGLLGSTPSRREIEALRRQRSREDDPLQSEPRIDPRDRRRPRLRGAQSQRLRGEQGQRPRGEQNQRLRGELGPRADAGRRPPPEAPPRRGFGP